MALSNIQAMIAIHAGRIQALEDLIYSMILARSLTGASGATLDLIGEMLRHPRSQAGPDASDDSAYRALLFGRIAINTSGGEPESVLSLLRFLGATDAYYRPVAPAGAWIDVGGPSLLVNDATLLDLVKQATPPIRIGLTVHDGSGFGFAGDPDAQGFGQGSIARTVS